MNHRHPVLNTRSTGCGTPFLWGHGLTLSMELENEIGVFDWGDLSEVATLVRYDARGHGQSEATYAPADYHWASLGRDMLALADDFGFAKFAAGGQSMGCATALYSAFLEPDRVHGLVLVNPPTAWETRTAQASIYEQMARLIETQGIPALVELMRQRPLLPGWQMEARPELADVFLKAASSFQARVMAPIFRGANCNFPTRKELADLKVPTLILAWVDDPTHPLEVAEELHSLLPHSRLVVARTMGDLNSWTQEIRTFLASGFPDASPFRPSSEEP